MSFSYQPRPSEWVFKKGSDEAKKCWQGWVERTEQDSLENEGAHHMEELAAAASSVPISGIVWKDGSRWQGNFLHSDFCLLDFDGGVSIQEIKESMCDMRRIIITTASHEKSKKVGGPDKFRLVLQWSERITSARVYKWNMRRIAERFGSDMAATDPARFFFPGREVIEIDHDQDAYTVDVIPLSEIPLEFDAPIDIRPPREKVINSKGQLTFDHCIKLFLTKGLKFGAGRNQSVFVTAGNMRSAGIPQSEAVRIIDKAPFDREDFGNEELIRTVVSAYSR